MNYLTVHEFGSLRGVSIGSLRYYEKLGLLKPAKVDPDTGYRYYLPEQLETLDVIRMCVELDIPLKEIKDYEDEQGHLELKRILERGRQELMDRIKKMNTRLEITEHGLEMLQDNEAYRDRHGMYTREIEQRWFYCFPASGDKKKLAAEQKQLLQCFRDLQKRELAPAFPAGVLLRSDDRDIKLEYLIRVYHPDETDDRIVCVPEGTYKCLQRDMSDQPDLKKLINDNFPDYKGQTVIITNMMTEKLHYHSRLSEIQVADVI
jgi:MerR family transcriptional activator of bmr gene